MALRINTNVAAINAHRQLQGTERRLSTNMERLSSGYRINHASDDAAGLSIANRLRANVKSLTVASRNVSEAKSLVSVAEGAANQIESMLEHMKELLTQSASDNAGADRAKIFNEIMNLAMEMQRIVEDTEYQGVKLLNGTFGNSLESISDDMDDANIDESNFVLSGAAVGTFTFNYDAGEEELALIGENAMGESITQSISVQDGAQIIQFSELGVQINTEENFDVSEMQDQTLTVSNPVGGGIFQVGSGNINGIDTIRVELGNLNIDELFNIPDGDGGDDSMLSREISSLLLLYTDRALDTVNDALGEMGATMNRLDYAYANLQVTIENFQASESVIRDVDMADEMVSFTNNQILLQAGTAMLAQANLSSQTVLYLLE